MKRCAAQNTCPICSATEPCAGIHLSPGHRNSLCGECLRWIIRRRDELAQTLGITAAERQAKEELQRVQRELDPEDFRSYRDPSR